MPVAIGRLFLYVAYPSILLADDMQNNGVTVDAHGRVTTSEDKSAASAAPAATNPKRKKQGNAGFLDRVQTAAA